MNEERCRGKYRPYSGKGCGASHFGIAASCKGLIEPQSRHRPATCCKHDTAQKPQANAVACGPEVRFQPGCVAAVSMGRHG
jgi:hypothetical protein